jgi:hypothetical protein
VATTTRSPSVEIDVAGTAGKSTGIARRQREADLRRPQVAAAQLVRPTAGDDLTVAHDRDPTREQLRLVHEVGGEDDGLTQVAQRADRRPRLAARRRVKSRRRLVQEDQVRVADQRER